MDIIEKNRGVSRTPYTLQTDLIGNCIDKVNGGIHGCNPGSLGDLCESCSYKDIFSLCREIMVIGNVFIERRSKSRIVHT